MTLADSERSPNSGVASEALIESPPLSPPSPWPIEISFFGRDLTRAIQGDRRSNENATPRGDELIEYWRSRGIYLSLPRQQHGAVVALCAWNGERPEADALFANREPTRSAQYLGVVTADCVPVVLSNEHEVSVVHAGWRGLAARILSVAAQKFTAPITHCAIGPCAGSARYQVGPEVIEAIGSTVQFKTISGKLYLDLVSTALRELQPWLNADQNAPAQVWTSGICTISDERFYSFRREGRSGHNLTLVRAS